MIITKRSDELRPGDVFSTNGATVEAVVYLPKRDEVCITSSFPEDGDLDLPFEQRFDYVAPSTPVHVWVPADEAEEV